LDETLGVPCALRHGTDRTSLNSALRGQKLDRNALAQLEIIRNVSLLGHGDMGEVYVRADFDP
jgi:hypothetical protein